MSLTREIKAKLRRYLRSPIDICQSWVQGPLHSGDMIAFQSWFDRTKSMDQTRGRACRDWERRITAFEGWNELTKLCAVEIGFGGGRLLARASRDFHHVLGVDIHSAFEMTQKYLSMEEVQNYRLLTKSQFELLPDASVDFIYSFIVFQHFATFQEVEYYVRQIERLLKPTGVCHLFFRRGDQQAEPIRTIQPEEFSERHSSLFIRPEYFREYLKGRFEILDFQDILDTDPHEADLRTKPEGQARVLIKPKTRV